MIQYYTKQFQTIKFKLLYSSCFDEKETLFVCYVTCFFWFTGLQGKILYSNGDTFDGQFSNGHIEGEGTLKCVNGVEYKGEWKHSQVASFSFSLSL